jgi:undecaprenyl-diphosphatase
MALGWLLLLAILQGLTEFLPVSSSGHLALTRALLGDPALGSDVSVAIALHLGTLGAVLAYFRSDLAGLVRGALRPGAAGGQLAGRERALLAYLVVGTLPAAAAGLLARSAIEGAFDRPRLVGAMLLLTAASLLATRWMGTGTSSDGRLGAGRALVVGAAQALALLPGVSRSGATIVAGLALGLEREAAFRFSFLLSIPAILGAATLETWAVLARDASLGASASALAGAVVVAGVVGYVSLAVLRQAVSRRSLHWFALYCAVVGAAALALGNGH